MLTFQKTQRLNYLDESEFFLAKSFVVYIGTGQGGRKDAAGSLNRVCSGREYGGANSTLGALKGDSSIHKHYRRR